MKRLILPVVAFLGLVVSSPASGVAQTTTPPSSQPATDTITLGQSVVPLNGPYKFTIGDSPIDPATHQPLWSEPTFDDSHWETVDLTPSKNIINPSTGRPGFVPGWTAKGHPSYAGYAWYRIRIRVQGVGAAKLGLAAPAFFDDSYQAFANGALLGSFGDFSHPHPTIYVNQPGFFPIPTSALHAAPDGTLVLAFRFWMDPLTLSEQSDLGPGGFHAPPDLGQRSAMSATYEVTWLNQILIYSSALVEVLLLILLAVLSLSLAIFDRSDKVYYWIAAAFLIVALSDILQLVWMWGQFISASAGQFVIVALSGPLIVAAWLMVWWVWFKLKRPRWLPAAVAILTLLNMLQGFGEEIYPGLVSHQVAKAFLLISAGSRLALFALLVLIVVLGVRRQGREGWLVLPAVVLFGVTRFDRDIFRLLHIALHWNFFGVVISLAQATTFLFIFTLFILLLRRVFVSLRTQRQQALDIKQAAEVQQVILPDSHFTFPGLAIETEYRPAREVGGDFFQLIPHPTDGSLLIVAGDVTGKGLQAGMLVALLVGATRSTAELNPDPLVILQALNRRLLGRKSAQATAVALRIAPDGHATLANAGHIPPYLNGNPLDMEGSLPLGMIPDADFSVMHFQLAPHDKLVLISDGILEATDPTGQLFGFDRVQQFLRDNLSPSALADAAQLFGQEDDISLISLTRAPHPA